MPLNEIYAHIAVAEKEAMKAERLATLVANLKPNDLARMRAWPSTSPTRSFEAVRCPSLFIASRSRRSGNTAPMN
jgi:hypothetical protein